MDRALVVTQQHAQQLHGLPVAPRADLVPYVDRQQEALEAARWVSVLTRLNITPVAIRDIPLQPVELQLGHQWWRLRLLDPMGPVQPVPPYVGYRVAMAEIEGIPVSHWLLGEELAPRTARPSGSRFVPPPIVPDAQALAAARQREQATYNAWLLERQPRPAPVVIDASHPRRDPVLIGVVILGTAPVYGAVPNRGLWTSFGKWED